MSRSPDFSDIVDHPRDPKLLKKLITDAARSGEGPYIGQAAHTAGLVQLALCLSDSVAMLREALKESAKAANSHAKNLSCATWALVFATLALFATALVSIFMS